MSRRPFGRVIGRCERGSSGIRSYSVQEITAAYVSANEHSHTWLSHAKVGDWAVIDDNGYLIRIFDNESDANTYRDGWNGEPEPMPLRFHKKSGDWMSEAEFAERKREEQAKEKIKQEEEEKERWDELVSLSPSS